MYIRVHLCQCEKHIVTLSQTVITIEVFFPTLCHNELMSLVNHVTLSTKNTLHKSKWSKLFSGRN